MNLRVEVDYKNKNLKTVNSCKYDLKDYTEMISLDWKRIITDIEDLCYMMNDGKSKDEWNGSELSAFNKIKHKILDKAGEIERLSDNIYDADEHEDSITSFWDKLKRG